MISNISPHCKHEGKSLNFTLFGIFLPIARFLLHPLKSNYQIIILQIKSTFLSD